MGKGSRQRPKKKAAKIRGTEGLSLPRQDPAELVARLGLDKPPAALPCASDGPRAEQPVNDGMVGFRTVCKNPECRRVHNVRLRPVDGEGVTWTCGCGAFMQASYHDTHKPVEGSPSRLWLSNRLASLSRFVARTGTRLGSWLDRLSLTVIR